MKEHNLHYAQLLELRKSDYLKKLDELDHLAADDLWIEELAYKSDIDSCGALMLQVRVTLLTLIPYPVN